MVAALLRIVLELLPEDRPEWIEALDWWAPRREPAAMEESAIAAC
jgi:hypothetical protein